MAVIFFTNSMQLINYFDVAFMQTVKTTNSYNNIFSFTSKFVKGFSVFF